MSTHRVSLKLTLLKLLPHFQKGSGIILSKTPGISSKFYMKYPEKSPAFDSLLLVLIYNVQIPHNL